MSDVSKGEDGREVDFRLLGHSHFGEEKAAIELFAYVPCHSMEFGNRLLQAIYHMEAGE